MNVIFDALAEPHRREILNLLRNGELPVGEIVTALGISQPGASKHLRILRDAGLVVATVDRQRRLYAVRPEGLAAVEAWLAPYRRFWADRLDALDTHLSQEQ